MLTYSHGFPKLGLFAELSKDMKSYGKELSQDQKENIVNVMTNEFPAGTGKKTYSQCVFIEELEMTINQRNRLWKCYQMMIFIISLKNWLILE